MIFFHNALVVMTPSGCKFQLINSNCFIQSIFKASVMQQVKVPSPSSHVSASVHGKFKFCHAHEDRSSWHSDRAEPRCSVAVEFQTCIVFQVSVMQLPHAYLISALSGNILAFNVCACCAVAVGTISLRFHDLKKKSIYRFYLFCLWINTLILMQWKKKGKQTSEQKAQHQTQTCLFFSTAEFPQQAQIQLQKGEKKMYKTREDKTG